MTKRAMSMIKVVLVHANNATIVANRNNWNHKMNHYLNLDGLSGLISKIWVDVVGKCFKFLISKVFFLYKEYCIKYFLSWFIIAILNSLIE